MTYKATKEQWTVLAYIDAFVSVYGYPPNLREIAKRFDYSKEYTKSFIGKLYIKRWVTANNGRQNSFSLTDNGTSVVNLYSPLFSTGIMPIQRNVIL